MRATVCKRGIRHILLYTKNGIYLLPQKLCLHRANLTVEILSTVTSIHRIHILIRLRTFQYRLYYSPLVITSYLLQTTKCVNVAQTPSSRAGNVANNNKMHDPFTSIFGGGGGARWAGVWWKI